MSGQKLRLVQKSALGLTCLSQIIHVLILKVLCIIHVTLQLECVIRKKCNKST